ncbi:MAG: hypothetical protein WC437_03045 [Patescibacteria group bacterium]
MKVKDTFSLVIMVLCLAFIPVTSRAMSSTNYRLDAFEINSVSGVGSSTNYNLVSSGGEPFIKEGSSANYKLGPGFPYMISNGMIVGFYSNGSGIYQGSSYADVALGNILAGTPVTGQTDINVRTDAPGYSITVKRNDANSTMDLSTNSSTDIPDKTAWDPTGSGNAATWTGVGLGFSVFASSATKNTTWWGTGTTKSDANNKYAGFPITAQTIMNHVGYTTSETSTSVGYKLDVSSGQTSGYYDGIITYYVTMSL